MLVAAAVCPHPPLLMPELAAGAAGGLDALRAACDRAVAALRAAAPDRLVVIGSGARDRTHGPDAGGDLRPYGVALPVGPPPAVLPLSLTVGRRLADRAGVRPDAYVEVSAAARPGVCRKRGAAVAAGAPRVAALVMGDGSARRGGGAPGGADDRAAPFDAEVAAALAAADPARLAALDPRLAADLGAAGRPAWQTLAGAADGAGLRGALLAHTAPYGVAYFVALWS
ncbi:class III extradiol ring-cleavage dioxygenase family protein [Nocardiopsis trehalosi]|uniref:hypothetical protein n=1 Tax=Nocardiopsis trehalosi TaxID=109329 RepID=UPI000831BCD6|nr:hypothetical protein [Nocardiopsis trehalosi]